MIWTFVTDLKRDLLALEQRVRDLESRFDRANAPDVPPAEPIPAAPESSGGSGAA